MPNVPHHVSDVSDNRKVLPHQLRSNDKYYHSNDVSYQKHIMLELRFIRFWKVTRLHIFVVDVTSKPAFNFAVACTESLVAFIIMASAPTIPSDILGDFTKAIDAIPPAHALEPLEAEVVESPDVGKERIIDWAFIKGIALVVGKSHRELLCIHQGQEALNTRDKQESQDNPEAAAVKLKDQGGATAGFEDEWEPAGGLKENSKCKAKGGVAIV